MVSHVTTTLRVKRKGKVLTIDDKISIIKQLEVSSNKVKLNNTEFGKNTISDIKNKKILTFQREMSDIGIQKKAKIMKLGNDVQHDKAVILWFKQKTNGRGTYQGVSEKAVQLHKKLYGDQSQDGNGGSVSVTESVICHFKMRNCLLTREQVMNFSSFAEFVEHHLTLNQIFNCEEKDLIFTCYQTSHWLHPLKNQQMGGKSRVTINACANATGTVKLPLQLIGKAKGR